MKISIITATFNSELTIEKTLLSVQNQKYKDIEYIIIDNKSDDKTIDIVKKYNHIVTRVISEQDNGIYDALNKGIINATGDVVGFLHSDDELFDDNVLLRIADTFNQHEVDSVYGNGVFVSYNNPEKIIRNWISGEFKLKKLKKGWMPMHPTFFVKRNIYKNYGIFDEKLKISADYDLILRFLLDKKISTYYIEAYLIKMKMGGASTSLKNSVKKWKEDWQVMKHHKLPPLIAIFLKNISKTGQFIKKDTIT